MAGITIIDVGRGTMENRDDLIKSGRGATDICVGHVWFYWGSHLYRYCPAGLDGTGWLMLMECRIELGDKIILSWGVKTTGGYSITIINRLEVKGYSQGHLLFSLHHRAPW